MLFVSSSESILIRPFIPILFAIYLLGNRLETQMFASFEEECTAGPHSSSRDKSSEVVFFEESILAKKNRSALSYKSFTPFLSDTRSATISRSICRSTLISIGILIFILPLSLYIDICLHIYVHTYTLYKKLSVSYILLLLFLACVLSRSIYLSVCSSISAKTYKANNMTHASNFNLVA